jgi:hypothetical protein
MFNNKRERISYEKFYSFITNNKIFRQGIFLNIVMKYQIEKYNKNSWKNLMALFFCHLSKANSTKEVTNGFFTVKKMRIVC